MHIWKAYRRRYGSLFFGRRIEQGFGGWTAHYTSFKTGNVEDAFQYMPHEINPNTRQDDEFYFDED